MRIACVGGGPAGLLLATLARRSGTADHVVVYERQAPDATYGWGVVFWDDLVSQLRAVAPDLAQSVLDSSVQWGSQALERDGRRVVRESSGGGGFSIGRRSLLEILSKHATDAGVDLRYGHTVLDSDDVPDADLIVAADGAGSSLRLRRSTEFGTKITDGANKYIWLGTPHIFDGFTFALEQTPFGWIWFHGYPFSDDMSTCVVECSAATWNGLGFDRLDSEECANQLTALFATALHGEPLVNRSSTWLNFRTVTNARWHHENVVLAGDAAHTTHFTIGSGTRLAFEDAISLATHLHASTDVSRALIAYEQERQSALVQIQSEARFSARWFERIERYAALSDEQLFAVLRERRSPLLARIPPRLYYEIHDATERFAFARKLRHHIGPRARALYSRRFG
jgi:2-polyprenyl-6-methoxyphenol hydroxylase-like FAD-dependent oxidoreductase